MLTVLTYLLGIFRDESDVSVRVGPPPIHTAFSKQGKSKGNRLHLKKCLFWLLVLYILLISEKEKVEQESWSNVVRIVNN